MEKIIWKLKGKAILILFFIAFLTGTQTFGQTITYDENGNILPEFTKTFVVKNETVRVEMQHYPLYFNMPNQITVAFSENKPNFRFEFNGCWIMPKPITDNQIRLDITPTEMKREYLKITYNDSTISIPSEVSDLPDPIVFFNKDFKSVLLRKDLKQSKIYAECLGKPCKIMNYRLTVIHYKGINMGCIDEYNTPKYDGGFLNKKQIKELNKLESGEEFWIEDMLVELPNGTYRKISSKFKILDNENFANINSYWGHRIHNECLNPLKSDLRIQIIGLSKAQEDTLNTFFIELNKYLNGAHVKIANTFPSITYNSNKGDYASNWYSKDFQFFFPYSYQKSDIDLFDQKDKNNPIKKINIKELINQILSLRIGVVIENCISHDKTGYHLMPLCKEYLQTLYAKDGEAHIFKGLGIENPENNQKSYTLLIVILSLLVFMVAKELIASISWGRNIAKTCNPLWLQILFCMLIAQLPLSMNIFIKYINGIHINMAFLGNAEAHFLSYAVIVGSLLWLLDRIQAKIKLFALKLLIELFASVFIFWGAYQIIFFATHFDYVRMDMLRWQWIYVPLSVAIYRIYSIYNRRKIDQLLQEKELEISKQKELTTKAELLALQSRINPHFLYNALNSIASLAVVDAQKTEQMAVNLSKLFRYNLNKGDEIMTTVEQELGMVRVYLDIEKQRFGDRLNYQVDVPADLMEFQIPIFLLQPLVENAIKHGISKITDKGELKIKMEREISAVYIKIYDNGPLFANELITGYGLQNIFDKLTLVYKDNYTMRFVNQEKHIEIKIISAI